MATIDLGKIKLSWKGTWVGGTTYEKNDTVRNGTTSYICKEDHTADASTFTNDSAKWDVMAEGVEFPSTSGNAGKYLTNDGTNPSWGELVLAGGGTDTTDASANITLTSSSDQVQKISFNASGFKVNLPDATTMEEGTAKFIIQNKGRYAFTLLNNSGVSQQIVNPGQKSEVMLLDNSTSAGVWETSVTYDNTALRQIASGDFSVDSDVLDTNLWVLPVSANKIVCIYNYRHPTNGSSLHDTWKGVIGGRVGTISDDGEISWGSETIIYNHSNNLIDNVQAGIGIDGYAVVFFRYFNNTDVNIKYVMLDCTGSTISVGGENTYHTVTNNSSAYVISVEMMPGTNTGNFVWWDTGSGFFRQSGFTLGTNTISIGGSVQRSTNAGKGYVYNSPFTDTSGTSIIFDDVEQSSSHYGRLRMSSQSGNTISQGSSTASYRLGDAYVDVSGKLVALDSTHALLFLGCYGRSSGVSPSPYYIIEWTGSGASASFDTTTDGNDLWISYASFVIARGSYKGIGNILTGGRHTTVASLDLSNNEIIIHEANDNNTATLSRVYWDATSKELVKIGEVIIPGGNPTNNNDYNLTKNIAKLPGVNKFVVAHQESVGWVSSENIKFSVIEYGA